MTPTDTCWHLLISTGPNISLMKSNDSFPNCIQLIIRFRRNGQLKKWHCHAFHSFVHLFICAQNGSDPFIGEKKNCSDYRVHGIQIDWLRLTVSMQKSVLKNMHRVPRYHQKSVKNWPSKPNQQNLTHFGRFLWPRCIFFKIVFCVETVSPSQSIWIPWTL